MTAAQAIDIAARRIHPLRLLRLSRRITRAELHRRTGVSTKSIQRTEEERTLPDMRTRQKLLRFFGIDHSEHRAIFGELPCKTPRRFV